MSNEIQPATTEREPRMPEEVRTRLSALTVDLKRISDRLTELVGQTEAAADEHENACECADKEADHAGFLLMDETTETAEEAGPGGKAGAQPSEGSETEEPPDQLSQVLEEFRRHLSRMNRSMTEVVAAGREVGELGCELLRCERDLRALLESAGSESAPHAGTVPRGEQEA